VTAYLLREYPLFTVTLVAYAAAFVLYASSWLSKRPGVARAATWLMIAAMALNAALIVFRWVEAGRPPFKSLYESLVFLAFCTSAVYLVMEKVYGSRVFGGLAALGSLGALVYAVAKWDAEIVKLPPALQSGWFIPHVVVYFIAYGALFFATAVALVQLVKPTLTLNAGSMLRGSHALDDISYDAIRVGFTLLTIGLLIGSVWAKSAWGDYWVWDPKESWSLVTWLVYAVYLHLRHVRGWRGSRASAIAIAGFAVVLFTYLGMNALPTAAESEHVYQ
jgi:cytochrome c-type biogenesis protein CcsB